MKFSLRRLLLVMVVMALTLGAGLPSADLVVAICSIVAACALGGIVLRWNSDGWLDAADAAAFTLLGAALMAWYMYPGRDRNLGFLFAPDLPRQMAVSGALIGAMLGGGAYLAVSALVRAIARMPLTGAADRARAAGEASSWRSASPCPLAPASPTSRRRR